jgi:hypothetical protein
MPIPRSRSWLGIAKETVHSNGAYPSAVTTPTNYIPVTQVTPMDTIKYIPDVGWRGSMSEDYDRTQGPIYSQVQITGSLYPDTFGFFLAGILGDYKYQAALTGQPSIHQNSLLNGSDGTLLSNAQTTSYSLIDYYGLGTGATSQPRLYAGCQFSDLSIKFSADGLLEYSATALGFPSQYPAPAAPSVSLSAIQQVPAWTGVLALSQAALNATTAGQYQVTNVAQSTNVVTLTTGAAHGLVPGQTINVANCGIASVSGVDGTWVCATGTTGSTIVFLSPTSQTIASTPIPAPFGSVLPQNVLAQQGDITFKRTVTPMFTVQGTQSPYSLFQGPLSVTGTGLFIAEDDTIYNLYRNNVRPALDVNFFQGGAAPSLTITGASGGTLLFVSPQGTSGTIAYTATAATVQAAINAIPGLGAVTCTGGPLNTAAVVVNGLPSNGVGCWANTTALTGSPVGGLIPGTQTNLTGLQIQASKTAFEKVELKRDKDYVEYNATLAILANAFDSIYSNTLGYSPVKAYLRNQVASAAFGN